VAKVAAQGFPVTEAGMHALAESVGEQTLFGRTGGATTFAVGMAQAFAQLLKSAHLMDVWYHFALMFEALFILTTIDAGTRVGRFLMQDLLGQVWRPLGVAGGTGSNVGASALFVGAWGWFLYQGVVDRQGGINALWPIFGIANQLLAVIALALGTTVLIKMGRARYAWVTLVPLVWLVAVTMSAGWMKLFDPDPRIGFLAQAANATGRELLNCRVNMGVTAAFLVMVMLVLGSCVREWVLLLSGRKEAVLRESEYRSVDAASLGA
jgi:carbon starvation protein